MRKIIIALLSGLLLTVLSVSVFDNPILPMSKLNILKMAVILSHPLLLKTNPLISVYPF